MLRKEAEQCSEHTDEQYIMRDDMKWEEMQQKMEIYERKWSGIPVIMVGGCIAGIFIGAVSYLPLIFIFWIIAIVAGFVYESSIALYCPYCFKKIQKNPRGGDSELLILKNMHQCPHCQKKFE